MQWSEIHLCVNVDPVENGFRFGLLILFSASSVSAKCIADVALPASRAGRRPCGGTPPPVGQHAGTQKRARPGQSNGGNALARRVPTWAVQ